MSIVNDNLMSGLGPLLTRQMIYDGASDLETTPILVTLDRPAETPIRPTLIRVKITNLSPLNRLAWGIVELGASAPTITATPGSTSGVIVPPSMSDFILMFSDADLYVVGSAASTIYSISSALCIGE